MPTFDVQIAAPSRLHFGMLSFGHPEERQFGGVGAMIDHPGLVLRLTAADQFSVHGPLAHRAGAVVERYVKLTGLPASPSCRVEIVSAPPEHSGLGTGTQFALSLVAGLNAFHGGGSLNAHELANQAGRAARSAVGTHGFLHGGLIFESGKLAGELVSPLEERVELPRSWRFVLIAPPGESGISGETEADAFCNLPPVPPDTSDRLLQEIKTALIPSAKAGQFKRFSESLYRYGYEAGLCFAAKQGGAFASPRIAEVVETIRSLGVRGVGQSSWGPTVFALLESSTEAQRFADQMHNQLGGEYLLTIAQPNNTGAIITRSARA